MREIETFRSYFIKKLNEFLELDNSTLKSFKDNFNKIRECSDPERKMMINSTLSKKSLTFGNFIIVVLAIVVAMSNIHA